MDRAYSVLCEKAFSEDEDFVYVEGLASTPAVDRVGDIVEPMGAKFKTPMPLLLNHNHNLPVGQVTFAKPTAKGIPFKAQIPRVKEEGVVKQRVDEAIHSLKYGLISAVSIGFKAVDGAVERLKSGGLRFKEWEWFELSLVPIPAQPEALITAIKSMDSPAVGGNQGVPIVKASGGSEKNAHKGSVKLIPRKK